jgi:acetyl-CoA carboxylase biotin carboxyl carrier protein
VKIEEIERLIEIVAKSEIDSLELKAGGVEIRIRKERRAAGPPAPPARTSEAAAPRSAAAARSAPPPQPVEEEAGLHVVSASMVGTFFRSPSPGAPPFVEAGDTVRKGQVLCIIEAMKLMNELESDATGRIVKVYVEDGQPVEFGESLFAVQPASP